MRRPTARFGIPLAIMALGLSIQAMAELRTDLSVTAIRIGTGDLESGGELESQHVGMNIGLENAIGRGESIGVSIGVTKREYDFSGPHAFGQQSAWSDVTETRFGLSWRKPSGNSGMWYLSPSIGFSREDGADWDDSIQYGGIVSYGYRKSDTLTIGIGAGFYSGLEETKGFPVLLVDWKINEKWRIGNPFRPGPTGPAGVELVYQFVPGMEGAIGGGWRSNRFRQNADGMYPNGVAEVEGFPMFLRFTWFASETLSLDAYIGMIVGGEVTQENAMGMEVLKEDLESAPLAALSLKALF